MLKKSQYAHFEEQKGMCIYNPKEFELTIKASLKRGEGQKLSKLLPQFGRYMKKYEKKLNSKSRNKNHILTLKQSYTKIDKMSILFRFNLLNMLIFYNFTVIIDCITRK